MYRKPYSELSARQQRRRIKQSLKEHYECIRGPADDDMSSDSDYLMQVSGADANDHKQSTAIAVGILDSSSSSESSTSSESIMSDSNNHPFHSQRSHHCKCFKDNIEHLKKQDSISSKCISSHAILKNLSSIENGIATVDKRTQKLEERVESLYQLMLEIRQMLLSKETPMVQDIAGTPMLEPASTDDEFQALTERTDIVSQLLRCESSTLHSTITRILKSVMTTELAKTYSFSGYGFKRQKTKKAISNHKIYHIIQDVILKTKFKNETQKVLDGNISSALRKVPDWEKKLQSTSEETTPEEPLPASTLDGSHSSSQVIVENGVVYQV